MATGSGYADNPRSDNYEFVPFTDTDLNASDETIELEGTEGDIPDRSDSITIACSPEGDASVSVKFYDDDDKTNTLLTITSDENDDLSSTGGDPIIAEVAVVSPYADVVFTDDSGAANDSDGCVYVR